MRVLPPSWSSFRDDPTPASLVPGLQEPVADASTFPWQPALLVFGALVALAVFVWNRSLARVVQTRTAELSRELEERRRAERARRAIEQRLQQAERLEALGRVAGGIAHDLNNYLTPIHGYTELARRELPEDSKAHGYLERLSSAASQAQSLVAEVLTFSRGEDSRRTAVLVAPIVGDAAELLDARESKAVDLRLRIGDDPGTVLGDSSQLQQIVLNLANNAIQAIGDAPGVVEIGLERRDVRRFDEGPALRVAPGSYVHLWVRDDGPGMDEDVRSRIFDPFFSTKALGEGTGLGLSVVHGIVQSHEGEIHVESAPGEGTRFDVWLPRHGGTEDTPLSAYAPVRGGTEHLLVVDDEHELVELLATQLELRGYQVTTFESGREALAAFRDAPDAWDLVITDQHMPDLTGCELATSIRRERAELPIVLVTGLGAAITSETIERAGIRTVLRKPFGWDELARVVRDELDVHELRPSPPPAEDAARPAPTPTASGAAGDRRGDQSGATSDGTPAATSSESGSETTSR